MLDPRLQAAASAHPLLASLASDQLDRLLERATLVSYRPKRIVLREGQAADRVYFLLRGAVRVYHRSAGGAEVSVKLFRAPALFGEMEVLAGRPFLEYVKTLEPAEIAHVPGDRFVQLVESDLTFAGRLARDLSARLCIATVNERRLAFCDLDARLANLLVDYVDLAGVPTGAAMRVQLPLSQHTMAQDLGVARRSILRSLEKMRSAGLVAKEGGRYVVLDVAALRAMCPERTGLVYSIRPSSRD